MRVSASIAAVPIAERVICRMHTPDLARTDDHWAIEKYRNVRNTMSRLELVEVKHRPGRERRNDDRILPDTRCQRRFHAGRLCKNAIDLHQCELASGATIIGLVPSP